MRFPPLEIVIMGKTSRLLLAVFLPLLVAACASAAEPQQSKPKVINLFNGKDLTGWSVYNEVKDDWKVVDGVLMCSGKGCGWLMSNQEFSDGSFYVEYRIAEKTQSGLAIRAPLDASEGGSPAYSGMEIQILDDDSFPRLRPREHTGAISTVAAPTKKAAKPVGEWNTMAVTFKGAVVVVILNGKEILAATLTDLPDFEELVKIHPGLLRKKGHVGLQHCEGKVEFRKVTFLDRSASENDLADKPEKKNDDASDQEKLQGKWQATKLVTIKGEADPDNIKELHAVIKDDNLEILVGSKYIVRGRFALDKRKGPQGFAQTIDDGKKVTHAGMFYALKGDALTLRMFPESRLNDPPTDFENIGEAEFLFVFRRQ
jgi:uncharacterized protein (TIGR03067 family)